MKYPRIEKFTEKSLNPPHPPHFPPRLDDDFRKIAIDHLQVEVHRKREQIREIETGGDHPPVELLAEIQAFQREIAYLRNLVDPQRAEVSEFAPAGEGLESMLAGLGITMAKGDERESGN